ncbi:serine hydrolase domain-containing protein [Arthrobacter sp. NPDC089319]|uniref:serine hydrolase domain-containing protein n=1 Tax=Arthrobacter sp. NPDC089319 TaxID=3155915 RepID=UPI0034206C9A
MTASFDAEVAAGIMQSAAAEDFSGAIHVRQGGQVLLDEAYGVATRRWNVPVSTETRFDVASVTKLFTAVAVLQQVDAGTLSLDGLIHDHVDLVGTQVPADVTLKQLLTHTSGIADDADEEAGESYEALWHERPNYSVTETGDFLPQFVHKTPNFPPGKGCRYCNVGYILAGLALEKATGGSYRDYVVENIFAPTGMTGGFFDMRQAVPDVAEGWEPAADGSGWRSNIYSYPPIGSPDGGAYATARDLVVFLDAVRAGRLLSPATTEALLTPQVKHHENGDQLLEYGFGVEFRSIGGRLRSLSKDGINTGASAIVEYFPDHDLTLAMVSNAEDGVWGPLRRIHALVQ